MAVIEAEIAGQPEAQKNPKMKIRVVNQRISLFLILLLCPSVLQAQLTFFPSAVTIPQAKSKDELDAYGLVFESKDPKVTIALANHFINVYPDSEFRVYILTKQMEAYEASDDYDGLARAGRQALGLSPRNIGALILMANALANRVPPNGPERGKLLADAVKYADEAHQQIENVVRPRSIPRQEFGRYKRVAEASLAAVYGLIALQAGDPKTAINQYEAATSLDPEPRGLDYYRLGIAYALNHQNGVAIQKLQRAIELGPPLISSLAQKQIEALQRSDPQ